MVGGGSQELSASSSPPLPQRGGWRAPHSLPSSLLPPFACPANGPGRLAPSLSEDCIICNVYPHTCAAAWEDKTRRRNPCSWLEGVYNQVIDPEPEPSWNGGVLMAPEDPASGKSGNQSLHRLAHGLPSRLPHSSLLLPGTASHPFTSAASADLGAAMWPFAFKYPDVAPMGAATGRWGAREQGLECASEGMATGLRSRKCCLRSLQGGRSSGGGWQPGGQLSCEQMTSTAAIALGRTTRLPRVKATGVGATKCQGPTDASGVSMQGPDGVVGLSSKLRSHVTWPRIRAWKRCA